jgi:hypothetical protein
MEVVGVAQADNQHREPFDLDLHAFNAFLVSMSWYSFVDSFEDRIALHKLVSIPGPTEPYVNQIVTIVKDYFKANMLKFGNQNYLLRRKIQSINGSVSLQYLSPKIRNQEIHDIQNDIIDALGLCGWKRLELPVERCLKSLAQVSE